MNKSEQFCPYFQIIFYSNVVQPILNPIRNTHLANVQSNTINPFSYELPSQNIFCILFYLVYYKSDVKRGKKELNFADK